MALPTDERSRRVILRRAARLAGLTDNPSFEELQKEADRKQTRIEKSLMARVLSPDGMNQRDVDYWRGFINGMKYLCAVPGGAHTTVERASREVEDSGSE